MTDIGGRSPVAVFESGDVDHTEIGEADAFGHRHKADVGEAKGVTLVASTAR